MRKTRFKEEQIIRILREAEIERWRQHYNRFRPHSSLGYRPPAPEAIEIGPLGMASLPLAAAQGLTWGADYHGGQVTRAGASRVRSR